MTGNKSQRAKKKISAFRTIAFIMIGGWFIFLSGCAEITPPHPVDIITHPFGKGFLKSGMNKKEVLVTWGEPDEIVDRSTDKFGMTKEKWIYRARIENVPIGVGYLTKTYYLYFEGDTLLRSMEVE